MATGKEFWLPSRLRLQWRGKSLQVRLSDGISTKSRILTIGDKLRLGYGETCEVLLGNGPDTGEAPLAGQEPRPPVVMELSRSGHPQGFSRITTPLSPEDLERFVELSVDGEPLHEATRTLTPGSSIDIVDKSHGRRYRMIVDPPGMLLRHPRWMAALALLILIFAGAYALYLQWNLHTTAERLRVAETRLQQAESSVRRAEQSASEALGRIASAESYVSEALRGFRNERDEAFLTLEKAFDRRMEEIHEGFRARLSEVSREDLRARSELETEMRQHIGALREELSGAMVQTYREFKAREQTMLQELATRFAATEPESEVFKRVFRATRVAVFFIRTEYRVRFDQDGEERDFSTFGTGFLVAPTGVVVTARHVLYPWQYERQLAVLTQSGLAEVLPGSGRITAWATDRRVHNDDPKATKFFPEQGYRRAGNRGPIALLYTSEPVIDDVVVTTPFGLMSVSMPQPGHTDLAVFQVLDFDRVFPTIELAPVPLKVETLDEVMTLGYPFARLQKGVAVPQPSRGIVRRLGQDLMELDSPMHPGLSGGPILNRDGQAIGMAVGVMESEVYGMAVRGEEIFKALRAAREKVREDQKRLREIGCDPGPVDGRIGRKTWQAYLCEEAKQGGP